MFLEAILRQFSGQSTELIGKQIGTSPQVTSRAISQALPLLFSALANNASQADGAESLAKAIDRDHDGGILNNLAGFLGTGTTAPGDAILRHVLGDRRQSVEAGLGQASGITTEGAGKLLSMLAPVVMGFLGKTKQEQGLDNQGLATLLAGVRSEVSSSPTSSLLSLLDADGDGQVIDDVGGFLGKFLK